MKCPYCLTGIHKKTQGARIVNFDRKIRGIFHRFLWSAEYQFCSECHNLIIWLIEEKGKTSSFAGYRRGTKITERIVLPELITKNPPPPQVPKKYTDDYKEAILVLQYSPKASAALSRRCLQAIIHGEAKIKKRNLYDEIEELISSNVLPSYINEDLHHVRVIGNFAAHPIKCQSTGVIFDVEPGEAEWNLEVLYSLFDFYFVQKDLVKKRKKKINVKLKKSGKKPIP